MKRASDLFLAARCRRSAVLFSYRFCSSSGPASKWFTADMLAVLAHMDAAQQQHGVELRASVMPNASIAVEGRADSRSPWAPLGTLSEDMDVVSELTSALPRRIQEVSHETPPPPTALLDMTRLPDDMVAARTHLQRLFPNLELHVEHSSGSDLTGTRTHIFEVKLRAADKTRAEAALSEAEQQALAAMFGEAVGLGYRSTLRRALHEALDSIQVPYPSHSNADSSADTVGVSVMGLYAALLKTRYPDLAVKMEGDETPGAAECRFALESRGEVLYSMRGPRENFPSLLLAALEGAAAKHFPAEGAALHDRIARQAVTVVLPRKHVRAKRVLRSLVRHYYGVSEEACEVHVTAMPRGLFAARVVAALPLDVMGIGAPVPCHLASATARSKQAASDAACVLAMVRHFHEIYRDQIAYHEEVQEMRRLGQDSDGSTVSLAPPLARGLLCQLEWALERDGQTLEVRPYILRAGTPHVKLGVTFSATVWVTELFAVAEGTSTPLAEAVDTRKNRSEQKAVASALARHYPTLCAAAAELGVERKLIDREGAPVPCDGATSVQPVSAWGRAGADDALLQALTSQAPQDLPTPIPSMSLLAFYRDRQGGKLVETVEYVAEKMGFVVTLRRPEDPLDRVLATAVNKNKTVALLSAYRQAVPRGKDGRRAEEEEEREQGILRTLPTTLPHDKPLESLVVALANVYGLNIRLLLTAPGAHYRGGDRYTAELWAIDATAISPDPAEVREGEEGEKTAKEEEGEGNERSGETPDTTTTGDPGEKRYLLGRGRADTARAAVVECARGVFEAHVRPLLSVFPTERVLECDTILTFRWSSGSILHTLTSSVVDEINMMSGDGEARCVGILRLKRHQDVFQLVFEAHRGKDVVPLEVQEGEQNVIAALHHLCEKISVETGATYSLSNLVSSSDPTNTVFETLEMCARSLHGGSVLCDVDRINDKWYCRLSIRLTDDLCYCLGFGEGHRKNDAIKDAAEMALVFYTAPDKVDASPAEKKANYLFRQGK